MKTIRLLLGMFIFLLALCTTTIFAQSGDQILDGIGETGLSARYEFRGNFNDWSRNNLHANIKGSGFSFQEDAQFGNVLSLPGKNEAYVSIPGGALSQLESISISGWIYLRSNKRRQVLLNFGKSNQSHLIATTRRTRDGLSYQVELVSGSNKYTVHSPAIEVDSWNHLTMVINTTTRTMRVFINGESGEEVKNVAIELNQLFDTNTAENNKLFLGRSLSSSRNNLDAMLYDFRIYRIPLNQRQIARIYSNAQGGDTPVVNTREESERSLPVFPESTPQLYNAYLTSVPDIEVETVVGHLPRLPRLVQGVYKNQIDGPKVRVIWPAPENNRQVLSPGTYTITGRVAGTHIQPRAIVTVKGVETVSAPNRNLEAFHLGQVLLKNDLHENDTRFIENRDKFITVLAGTNPDDFLYMFRNAYGQEQPQGAKPLGVWDSQQTKLRGHATGHYLTAIAQAYASTVYDESLKANFASKMTHMVDVLYDLAKMSGQPQTAGGQFVSDPLAIPTGPGKTEYDSDLSEEGIRTDYWNWGKGYISAYPPDQFIMLEKGATYGGSNAQVWAPYYTLHKILAGLMDIYQVSGNEKALEIVKGMSDWVYTRLDQLPGHTLISMWNSYIAGEYGGMNEAMARLYRLTQQPRYLEAAKLFDNTRLFFGDANHSHGLARNVDMFRGLHSNQHIPQILGALETYNAGEAKDYYHIADNFWYKATNDYMYSIGGVAGASNPANAECFTSEPSSLYENGFSAGGQNETCATYNLLKLARELFLFDQRGELMDYYERALYNQILASVAETTPANTYHIPLRPGSVKSFGNPDMRGFTCCNGTAIESSTKLQNSIYFRCANHQALFVNLYIPSTLIWSEKNLMITQETAYPKEDHTRFTIKGSGTFDLNVRVPHWATNGFFVNINGRAEIVDAIPGTYLTLSRDWKDGDIVELRMPFKFYLEPVMDQQNIASLFYGPVLLAAQENEPLTEWRQIKLNAYDISKSISGDPRELVFNIDGVVFKPFFNTYGRHSVYLDVILEE